MERKISKRLHLFCFTVAAVVMMMVFVMPASAEGLSKQQLLVDKAKNIFEEFMIEKNMAWFRDHLKMAKGFLIIPELLKGGFIVGGSGGSGVLVVKDEKTGDWSQPAFYTVGSVTLGLQIGGEKSEIIMMILTRKGLQRLYTSSFKFGGDASIAVGPVGGGGKRDILSDFISFVRSKGAFAGVSMEGAAVKANNEWNQAYYGKKVTPSDIIVEKTVSNPGSAGLLEAVRNAYK